VLITAKGFTRNREPHVYTLDLPALLNEGEGVQLGGGMLATVVAIDIYDVVYLGRPS